jgi:hypothetical protein
MKKFNNLILSLTVAVIDFLYQGRDIPRFWVLEEIARAPYFSFMSVLHFRESLGLRGPEHIHLMKEHFAQTLNETEHLEEMERRGGADHWVDRAFARHLVLLYYWIMVVYYSISPVNAYHINEQIEHHAAHTYDKYLTTHPDDAKIVAIRDDELKHAEELRQAMKLVLSL